jgi:hypothetical protein
MPQHQLGRHQATYLDSFFECVLDFQHLRNVHFEENGLAALLGDQVGRGDV